MTPESEIARILTLLDSDWRPTPEQLAEAEAALAVAPKAKQQPLPLRQP